MAYDGELKFDTKIDKTGFKVGIDSLGSIAKNGMAIVTGAVTAAGTAVSALGGYAIKVGKNFESSMSQVIATMGITKDTIVDGTNSYELLKKAAADAGAATVFSSSEAADALNYLALAGYNAEKAADALPSVLNLAAAGGMDLAYASDLATDAMAALSIEATGENLTKFGDQLAKTASTANTNVSQLGEAILTVGGTAKALAGGTTELNSALGVLANRGIKGSEGGTALRNIILALTAPTDQAAEAIEALGLSVYDTEGNMRPLNEIFTDLNKSLEGMSEGEKTQVLNEVFNKVDLKSAQALLAGCGDEFDNLTTALENCDGAMAQMAETMNDNLEGDLKSLESKSEAFGIAVYDSLQSTFRSLVQLGGEYVTQLTEAFNLSGFDGLAEALGSVLGDAVSRAAEAAPRFFSLGTSVLDSLVSGVLKNKDKITSAAQSVITGLIQTFATLFPDIISAGIEIITQLAVGMSENAAELSKAISDGLILIIDTISANASEFTKAATTIILALAKGLIDNLDKLLNSAFEIVETLCNELLTSKNIASITEAAIRIVSKLAEAILANAGDIVIAVAVGIAQAFDGLTSVFYDFKSEADILSEEQEILGENIDENTRRFKELKDNANQVAAEDLVDTAHIEDLYNQLCDLADESGNVKEKDRELATFITTELADATGIEIDMIDGKIQKYDELRQSIENVIAQKRAEIFIDANEEAYKEATLNETSVADQLKQQYADIEATKKKRAEMEAAAKKIGVTDILANKDTQGALLKQNGIDWEEYQKLGILQGQQRADIVENEELYKSYSETIQEYNDALLENANGNYEKVVEILDGEQEAFKTASEIVGKSAEEQRNILVQQVTDAKENAEFMLRQYQNGVAGISSEMVEDAQKQIGVAKSEYLKGGHTLAQAIADGVLEGKDEIDAAVAQAISAARAAISSATSLTSNIISRASSVLSGGKSSNIPMFANGGFLRDGDAIVAEAGPELISVTAAGVKVTPLSDNARNYSVNSAAADTAKITDTALAVFDSLARSAQNINLSRTADTGNIINSSDDHSRGDTTITEENHYHIYTQAANASDARALSEELEFVKKQDKKGKGLS